MKAQYQKQSYALFFIWLVIFAAALMLCALKTPDLAGLGAVRSVCLVSWLLLDVLLLLIYVTQSVYWISGTTYEQAREAGPKARKRYALRHLAVFLTLTAVYLLYCFLPLSWFQGSSTRHALVAAGTICAATVLSMRIHL